MPVKDLLRAIYYQGASIDDMWVEWRAGDDSLIDYSTGYTFSLVIADSFVPDTIVLTKTNPNDFIGAASNPNLKVLWQVADLAISPGVYQGLITANRTIDGKLRKMPFILELRRVPGPQSPA